MQKLRSLILTLSALTLVACQSGPMMPLQAGVQRMGARPLQSFANRSAKYQLDQVVVGAANPMQLQALAAKFQAQIVRQIA